MDSYITFIHLCLYFFIGLFGYVCLISIIFRLNHGFFIIYLILVVDNRRPISLRHSNNATEVIYESLKLLYLINTRWMTSGTEVCAEILVHYISHLCRWILDIMTYPIIQMAYILWFDNFIQCRYKRFSL